MQPNVANTWRIIPLRSAEVLINYIYKQTKPVFTFVLAGLN